VVLLVAAAVAAFRVSAVSATVLAVSGGTLGASALSFPSVRLRAPNPALAAASVRRVVAGPAPAALAQLAVMAAVVRQPSIVDPFPASVGLVALGALLPPAVVAVAGSVVLSLALLGAGLDNPLAPQVAIAVFLQLFGVAIRRLVVPRHERRRPRALG
jgi:hypothetical protein